MTGIDAKYLLNLYESAVLRETKGRLIQIAKLDPKGAGRLIISKYPEEFI